MEKLNTEILVSSLFIIGFDKVDAALYTYTLGKLSIDNRKLNLFEFQDSETSETFNKYVDYNGITFKLKERYSLDTNTSNKKEYSFPLKNRLHQNRKLIEYLNDLDFSEIMLKKLELYGIQNIEQIDTSIFSDKEIEIIKHLNFSHNNKTLKKTVTVNTINI